jgi:hypothetical protein
MRKLIMKMNISVDGLPPNKSESCYFLNLLITASINTPCLKECKEFRHLVRAGVQTFQWATRLETYCKYQSL